MRIREPPNNTTSGEQVLPAERCRNTRDLGSVTPQETNN